LKEPLKAPAHLVVSEILPPLESSLAELYRLDEAGLLLEIARTHPLPIGRGCKPLQGGGGCQLRFQSPYDVHFHFRGSFHEDTLLH
jgi:hypothetical protein